MTSTARTINPASSHSLDTNTSPTNRPGSFKRFVISLAISPALLIAATFSGALAITQLLAVGTSGAEALVLSAVVTGILGGFIVAFFNPGYQLPAALYSASFAGLMYLSLRVFWLDAPITLMSVGFLLIIPAALLGGYTASRFDRHQ